MMQWQGERSRARFWWSEKKGRKPCIWKAVMRISRQKSRCRETVFTVSILCPNRSPQLQWWFWWSGDWSIWQIRYVDIFLDFVDKWWLQQTDMWKSHGGMSRSRIWWIWPPVWSMTAIIWPENRQKPYLPRWFRDLMREKEELMVRWRLPTVSARSRLPFSRRAPGAMELPLMWQVPLWKWFPVCGSEIFWKKRSSLHWKWWIQAFGYRKRSRAGWWKRMSVTKESRRYSIPVIIWASGMRWIAARHSNPVVQAWCLRLMIILILHRCC